MKNYLMLAGVAAAIALPAAAQAQSVQTTPQVLYNQTAPQDFDRRTPQSYNQRTAVTASQRPYNQVYPTPVPQTPEQMSYNQTSVLYGQCRGLVAEAQTECLNRVGSRGGYTFVMMDTNGDKHLSPAELRSWVGLPAFSAYATGPHGRLTPGEFDARHAGRTTFAEWNYDSDPNWLSDEELATGIVKIWDRNGDGMLDEAEYDIGVNNS